MLMYFRFIVLTQPICFNATFVNPKKAVQCVICERGKRGKMKREMVAQSAGTQTQLGYGEPAAA